MNYLIYPQKNMWITQDYNGATSHSKHSKGNPASYPIDDQGEKNTTRDWFYCPCDELEIKRIYGVGTSGTNTIWLQSTSKVVTPTFTDYVVIKVTHPNDDDLSKLKVGQKFKRYEPIFREGNDNVGTPHNHMSIARGTFASLKNSGWVKNSLGAWVLSGNNKKPEECFYIDPNFTKVIKDRGLKFVTLPKIECSKCKEKDNQIKALQDELNKFTPMTYYIKK